MWHHQPLTVDGEGDEGKGEGGGGGSREREEEGEGRGGRERKEKKCWNSIKTRRKRRTGHLFVHVTFC